MRRAPLQWIPRSAPGRRRGFATAALAPADEPIWPAHDPRLTPRDEIIFLLHTAAEVEHALMAQYLYAGWSAMLDETRWSSYYPAGRETGDGAPRHGGKRPPLAARTAEL